MSKDKRERLARAFIARCAASPELAFVMPDAYFSMAKVEKHFFVKALRQGGLRRNVGYWDQPHGHHLWEVSR